MEKRTRQIAAVALLVVFALLALAGSIWYMVAGHGWNVAASNIDDSIGQMDGYTVFLFEGTQVAPMTAQGSKAESPASGSASSTDPEPSDVTSDATPAPSTVAPSSDEVPAASASAGSQSAPEGASSDPGTSVTERSLEGAMDQLALTYREKGATVYRIDVGDPRIYEDPIVVSKGDRRVGIFYIDEPMRSAQARVDVKLLKRQRADFIIGISPDDALMDADVPGVDLIICNKGDGQTGAVTTSASAFCAYAPYVGQAEAVIVSPSGVISSKTLELQQGIE